MGYPIAMQEDFGDLNPLIPSHYAYLVKKTIQAIRTNDFKVSPLWGTGSLQGFASAP